MAVVIVVIVGILNVIYKNNELAATIISMIEQE
jgi:hypothetical protein